MKKFKKKKSILFISLGLAIATIAFAADPYEAPGKPGKPSAFDWGKDFCELMWTKPRNDGGAPILCYSIQKREQFFSQWQECGIADAEVDGTIYGEEEATVVTGRVIDLTEGHAYKFRVTAINKAGGGEPSDPSDPIIIKP